MLPSTSQLSIKIREALDCQVFRAVIQYRGTVLDQEFVVKYAHNHRDHAKLEAEFQNYSDLSHSKITGIPDIIGCFTYSESKSLRHIILVMQDVGESLVRRQAGVTISERYVLIVEAISYQICLILMHHFQIGIWSSVAQVAPSGISTWGFDRRQAVLWHPWNQLHRV